MDALKDAIGRLKTAIEGRARVEHAYAECSPADVLTLCEHAALGDRMAALRKGATTANKTHPIAVKVIDLAWLIAESDKAV